MKPLLLSLGLAVAFLLNSPAFAGGSWIASGGGSFKDEHNPWFVRNTTQVNYCIAVDQPTISVSVDQVRQAVENAITYWKGEFSTNQAMNAGSGLTVASQSFTEVDCSTEPELRFVVGYGKLAQNEIDFFKDSGCLTSPPAATCDSTRNVMNYIGVTTRTDYDSVQLKGRGFVYISSDMGANVYQNDGNLISTAWSKPNLLQYALIHEMGHVFGFPHLGNGIMSEVFLEQMLDNNQTALFQNFPIEHFLFPGPVVETCNLMPNTLSWFQPPAGTTCLQLQVASMTANIPVLARPDTSSTAVQIGTLMGVNIAVLTDFKSEPGIFLHITKDQSVFTEQEAGFRGFIVGPSFIDLGAQANYVPISGGPVVPVYFRLTSTSFTMQANQSGKIGTVFSYESPIDLLLTQHP